MRNYLFDRQTEQDTPQQSSGAYSLPQIPGPDAARTAPETSRRRGVLVAALFVLLIAALTACVVLLRRFEGDLLTHLENAAARSWNDSPSEESPSYDSGDSGFGIYPWNWTNTEQTAETTIPRAPFGLGVTMSIEQKQEQTLSPQEIYRQVLPSVVGITAYSDNSGGSGSGVVLTSDGYILTNYHVIEGQKEATVTLLTSGETFPALLVGYAAEMDIAVLKVDAQNLTPARFGSSRDLTTGDSVYAIGNPMGYLYGTITDGIVSYLDRKVTVGGHEMRLIQTSAALNSGNSGGALVNASGQVVGITVAKIDPHSPVTAEGLGLAIPVSEARRYVNTLLRLGEMKTPGMGIMGKDWPEGNGVLVVTVNPDTPAEKAGLQPGDVIRAVAGQEIEGLGALQDIIFDLGVGAQMDCLIQRGEEELSLSFKLYQMS